MSRAADRTGIRGAPPAAALAPDERDQRDAVRRRHAGPADRLHGLGAAVDLGRAGRPAGSQAKPLNLEKEPITVTVDPDGRVFLQDQEIEFEHLVTKLSARSHQQISTNASMCAATSRRATGRSCGSWASSTAPASAISASSRSRNRTVVEGHMRTGLIVSVIGHAGPARLGRHLAAVGEVARYQQYRGDPCRLHSGR